MAKMIFIITMLANPHSGYSSYALASSQGEYTFSSMEKCERAKREMLSKDKFKDYAFYRQIYCFEY